MADPIHSQAQQLGFATSAKAGLTATMDPMPPRSFSNGQQNNAYGYDGGHVNSYPSVLGHKCPAPMLATGPTRMMGPNSVNPRDHAGLATPPMQQSFRLAQSQMPAVGSAPFGPPTSNSDVGGATMPPASHSQTLNGPNSLSGPSQHPFLNGVPHSQPPNSLMPRPGPMPMTSNAATHYSQVYAPPGPQGGLPRVAPLQQQGHSASTFPGPPPTSGTAGGQTRNGPPSTHPNEWMRQPQPQNSLPVPQNAHPWPTSSSATSSITPSPATSEPPSAKSSRNPSPIPSQRYDAMEGQFSSNSTMTQTSGPLRKDPFNPPVSAAAAAAQPWLQPTSQTFQPQQQQQLPIRSMVPSTFPPTVSMPSYTQPMSQPPPPPPSTLASAAPQAYSQNVPPPLSTGDPSQQARSSALTERRQYPQQYPAGVPPVVPTNRYQPGGPGNRPVSADYQANWQGQQPVAPSSQQMVGPSGPYGMDRLGQRMGSLSLQGTETVDLLQARNILPATPVDPPKIVLPNYDYKTTNCSPDLFRCTLTRVPESQSVLQKARLPLGILIHPFKDLPQLPVVQCNVIVRCRSCRTYINPYVQFIDQRRWKCNLCFRVNELQEEFQFDPVSKTYGDPTRRPEIKSATIEFIAPSEYMLRPPQPAVYLFVLDVSYAAVETGYLRSFCETLLEELEKLPGDGRTRVGFMTFDSSVQFYNLAEGLSQPQMLVVSDIDEVFLPCPDNLLVNLHESMELVRDLLQQLPIQFMESRSPDSALGAALEAGFKLVSPTGGRITVFQASLPNIGPGALKSREDPNLRAGKEVPNLGPANDFYKKLALNCSGQQVAVDLFILSSQYCDIATLSGIAKFSGGCIHYYPGFHAQLNAGLAEKFERDLKRYLTRKVGFEAVMRIRCTKGLSIHTFHGNFFVRSTDLLSLPNINPDAGFAMQMSIEEPLTDCNTACFQAALLYTSSKGERRIRVHTLCLPVTANVAEVITFADQQAVVGLLTKMAVDRSLTSSLSDARDALINACVDAVAAYKQTQGGSHTGVVLPYSLRLLPLYILAILKHVAFRLGTSTKLDDRVFAMNRMKTLPLTYLMTYLYPNMYPIHNLDDKNCVVQNDVAIPQPPLLHLTSEKFEKQGVFLLDTADNMYLYVCHGVSEAFCRNVLGVPNFESIPERMVDLPELDTPESERVRSLLSYVQSQRPFHSVLHVLRNNSKHKAEFLQYLIEDRTEAAYSYYEFVKHIQHQLIK